MKHFSTTLVLICTALTAALPLIAENLWDVIAEAENTIQQKYSTPLAQSRATRELERIIDSEKTDEEKIAEIHRLFPAAPKNQNPVVSQEFDYSQLIYRTPLQWVPHSIVIAYDINSETQILLSTETIRQEEDNKKRDDSNALSNSNTQNKTKNNQYGFYADLEVHTPSSSAVDVPKGTLGKILDWFQAKLGFKWVNDHQTRGQETTAKTSQWDESAQRAWRNLFEEKKQVFQSTKVSNCHLAFTISFQNNTDSDMSFNPENVRIPVYAGSMYIAMAKPVDPPPTIEIYANSPRDQQFRANLDTTSALSLIDYMQNNAPRISVESGQILISSNDRRIKNAVQESLQNITVPFRYRDLGLELQILKYQKVNGKQTTVGDALRALNAIFERSPFGLSEGICSSLIGIPLNEPNKDIDLRQLPVIVINGIPTSSVISADKLNQPISDDGISIQIANLLDDNDVWRNASDTMLLHFLKYMKAVAESGGAEVALRLGDLYSSGIGLRQDKAEALNWLKKAAELGNAEAQVRVGNSYYAGIGCNRDGEKAFYWYSKGADQGDAQAELNLAICHVFGYGCAQSDEKAFNMLKKAAGHGHAEAQYILGNCYYQGVIAKQDFETAANWYQKSADQGFANAQCALADCYYFGNGRRQNYYEAFRLYKKAAEQEVVSAQNKLGDFYNNGIGCEKDPSEAISWYRKAADQGSAEAKYSLGNIYDEKQSYSDAAKMYAEAADQGLSSAQYALGNYYYSGKGVPKSNNWAAICYEAAAQQSNPYALTKLGTMCYNGFYLDNGTSYRNYDLAGDLFWQAANLGYSEAQYRLALIYADEKDWEQVYYWLSKAAQQGHQEAQRTLNSMQRQQR